jgi:hypothetical protein
MEKNGMLTEKSQSDFDTTKKAEYYDKQGFAVADKDNKHRLKEAAKVEETQKEQE